jgi:hypothetical protein
MGSTVDLLGVNYLAKIEINKITGTYGIINSERNSDPRTGLRFNSKDNVLCLKDRRSELK